MNDSELADLLLSQLTRPQYKPMTLKAIAKRIQIKAEQVPQLRNVVRKLVRDGRVVFGTAHTIHVPRKSSSSMGADEPTSPAKNSKGIIGTLRVASGGFGFVRPTTGKNMADDIFIPAKDMHGALSGDVVQVEIDKKRRHPKGPSASIVRIVERSTQQFVGSYEENEGQGFVTIAGENFVESIRIGDAKTHHVKPGDQVVIDMVRFPAPGVTGEGVIVEVLGKLGQPGVDTKSVIRAFNLPEAFPAEVLSEARQVASQFNPKNLAGRTDFTQDLIITIDPPDAKDFDDALGLTFNSAKQLWELSVHIADVSQFCPPGSYLDREAQQRATSVYLPGKVLPMFPETISNHLASLQQDEIRFVQTVQIEFTTSGEPVHARFALGAIKVRKRFTYDQVSEILNARNAKAKRVKPATRNEEQLATEIIELLHNLNQLAQTLRKRRFKRGSLELSMPEVVLDYDESGDVNGAHLAVSDISHQLVEECMLSANEAVARHLHKLKVPFVRRIHPAPEPNKLSDYLSFVKSLGYQADRKNPADRFQLQRLLEESMNEPEQHAVHFALLRSLKQAVYSPEEDGHYALASKHYCHFTSPIRRYPDLLVHRLLSRWIRTGKTGGNNEAELNSISQHCSDMERRAGKAEEDLVRLRLLRFMESRIGSVWEAFITHVNVRGFSCQPKELPVEGFVHVASLGDDYYEYDDQFHSLMGRRYGKRYRLGDTVFVKTAFVDVPRRSLAFRVMTDASMEVTKVSQVTTKKPVRKSRKRGE